LIPFKGKPGLGPDDKPHRVRLAGSNKIALQGYVRLVDYHKKI